MPTSPSVKTRLMAWFQEEVSASDLEAYKVAGEPSFALLDTVSKGYDPKTATQQEKITVLCRWMAFALQSAGDAMLDADYETDPNTVGFVPQITRQQAQLFYEKADLWAEYGKEAQANPGFRLDSREPLPAAWPEWVEVEPCPTAHLNAMVKMAEKIGGRVRILYNVDGVYTANTAGNYINQLLARGDHKRDRALVLWRQHSPLSREQHETMESNVKKALAAYFLAGQLMAMPELERGDAASRQKFSTQALPQPGMKGFDQWCLTDPSSRRHWKRDHAASRAIESLWKYDPDPSATLRIQSEIDAAVVNGHVVYTGLGSYFCCPWSAIYQVVNPVTLGGKRLRRGQEFTFDVSAEEMAEGGKFKREIFVGRFSPTKKVDYCNPEEGGHDDD